jgi:hypothetical protein
MTFDDFMRLVLANWPDAVIDEHGDNDELVIYTGHKLYADNFDGVMLSDNWVVKMSNEELERGSGT